MGFNLLDFLSEEDYPLNPNTIGEHIRKRRMDCQGRSKNVPA